MNFFWVTDAITHLKNYALGETPEISVAAALDEAEKILREIKRRNFSKLSKNAADELV